MLRVVCVTVIFLVASIGGRLSNSDDASRGETQQEDPDGLSYTMSLGDLEGGEILVQADNGENKPEGRGGKGKVESKMWKVEGG